MINVIAEREDDELKTAMIKTLASYMKQQYLIWNKDSVSEETIFNDIYKLSDGRIKVPEEIHIGMGMNEGSTYQRNVAQSTGTQMRSSNFRSNKGKGNSSNQKKWKQRNNNK